MYIIMYICKKRMRTIDDIKKDYYTLQSETNYTKKLKKLKKLRKELLEIMFTHSMERINLKEVQRLISKP